MRYCPRPSSLYTRSNPGSTVSKVLKDRHLYLALGNRGVSRPQNHKNLKKANDPWWLERIKKRNLGDTRLSLPPAETTRGQPQYASPPALETFCKFKDSSLAMTTSPASPTIDDACRALETFLKYVALNAPPGVVSDAESQTVARLAKRMHVYAGNIEVQAARR